MVDLDGVAGDIREVAPVIPDFLIQLGRESDDAIWIVPTERLDAVAHELAVVRANS